MGTWLAAAQALITVADGAAVTNPEDPEGPTVPLSTLVARSFIAPGPDFAHDCSLLAVHVEALDALPVASDADLGPQFGCVLVPSILLHLTYADDCVPVPSNDGKPPTPEAVEAWSSAFLDRCVVLWQAVADAVLGGSLDVGGCHDASIGQATFTGPAGGMAAMVVPVRVRLQA